MSPEHFTRLALKLPDAVAGSHMGHPDFRVRKRVFATLQPTKKLGVVKLDLELQATLFEQEPDAVVPVGGFTKQGWTGIFLPKAKVVLVKQLLAESHRQVVDKATSRRSPSRRTSR